LNHKKLVISRILFISSTDMFAIRPPANFVKLQFFCT